MRRNRNQWGNSPHKMLIIIRGVEKNPSGRVKKTKIMQRAKQSQFFQPADVQRGGAEILRLFIYIHQSVHKNV